MEGDVNSSDSFSILELPPLVKTTIYRKLEQADALAFRALCKETKEEFDTSYEYDVQLNDQRDPEEFEFLISLRIKKCKILRWISPPAKSPMIRYPHCLRDLELNLTNKFNDFFISPANLRTLMRECSPSLQNLRFSTFESVYVEAGFPRYDSFVFNYKNLKGLEIHSNVDDSRSRRRPNTLNLDIMPTKILEGVRAFPSRLVSMDLVIGFAGETEALVGNRFMAKLVSCITSKWQTLKVLRLNFISENGTVYSQQEIERRELERLGKLKLVHLSLSVAKSRSNMVSQLIRCLMQGQRNLESAFLNISEMERVETQNFIWYNCQSLKSLYLQICTGFFDLRVLQYCVNLKSLFLSNQFFLNESRLPPRVRFLEYLPESIEQLKLRELSLKSVEIYHFFGKQLKGLKELEIMDCQSELGHFMNCYVLKKVLGMPNILRVYLDEYGAFSCEGFRERVKKVLRFYNVEAGNNYRRCILLHREAKNDDFKFLSF